MVRFLPLGLLLACDTGGAGQGEDDVIDLRADYPDPPAGGMQILTPDLRVEPYAESLYCFFGQWDGPDIGVNSFIPLHPNEFHHHSLVKDANRTEGAIPGEFLPCGDGEEDVSAQTAPLFHAISLTPPEGEGNILTLPEGSAVKLSTGQLWSADVHFINPTDTPLLVNVAFNLGLVEAEYVEHWISSFDYDVGELALPPGEETTIVFDCPLLGGTDLLSVLAHMHGYGERYLIELVRESGEIIELLRVEEWQDDYRYSSPSRNYQPEELLLEEGDMLRTHCTWFNNSPDVLSFPDEMCTTSGAILGLESAQFCIGTRVGETE